MWADFYFHISDLIKYVYKDRVRDRPVTCAYEIEATL